MQTPSAGHSESHASAGKTGTPNRNGKAKPPKVEPRASGKRAAADEVNEATATSSVVASGQVHYLPLKELKLSKHNVRKDPSTNIEALAASIGAHQLIQNLTVTKEDDAWGVVAGWRRVLALRLLAKRKKIPSDQLVPCRVVDTAEAVSISLAENVEREQMSAADEFEAWQRLVDQGHSVEAIAASYGVTPVVISRRLRLANVSPRLFAAFRQGEIAIGQLMALAATTDHDLQEAVWDQCPQDYRHEDNLRRRVKESKVAVNSPVGQFVGVKAYRKAGGAIETDLFAETDADHSMFADQLLFQKLLDEKLQVEIDKLVTDGWRWAIYAEHLYDASRGYRQISPLAGEFSDADKARDAETLRRLVALESNDPNDEPPADPVAAVEWQEISQMTGEQIQEAMNAIYEERNDLEAAYEYFPDRIKAIAGVFLTITPNGLKIHPGWLKEDDLPLYKQIMAQASGKTEGPSTEDGSKVAVGEDQDGEADSVQGDPSTVSYSEPLSRRLSSARTALLQSAMLKQPDVALRTLVLAMLAHSPLCGFRSGERFADAVQVRHNTTYGLVDTAPEIKEFRTLREVDAKTDYWTSRFADEGKDQTLEQSVFSLTGAELSELLTLLVALGINAVCGRNVPATAQPATALAQALGFQARDGWRPTAASYFNHVPKKQILSDVQEFAPDSIAELSKLTKSALAGAAEKLAEKTEWVPVFMRQ